MDNEHVQGADALIRKLRAALDYIDQDVPLVIGTEAVNHFKESFTNEGFTDGSLEKWKSRKSKRKGSTNGQTTLSGTRELEDSITFRVEGKSIVISTDKKYAQIHNEGGEIKVTANMKAYFWAQYYMAEEADDVDLMNQWKGMALCDKIVIPKRQFIGPSSVLDGAIIAKIERDLTNILQ
jgi:phage gpG-like protein